MREAVFSRPPLADVLPAGRPLLPLSLRDVVFAPGGVRLIDGLSLTLGPVGCTVIMGPNGAGKSLALRLLHGLILPDAGAVDWNGTAAPAATARQAMVFQKPVLLRRSVRANLDFVCRDRARVAALLDHVGLADKADRPARLLSGGEAQRLALARALATDPEVLFLDEPTASLDPASTQMIEASVNAARARGVRIVFVTHDIGQARRMADDVVFLHRGRVAEHAPASRFFPLPASEAARGYIEGRIVL
jgi:tungstate transport system ATP-binding protein